MTSWLVDEQFRFTYFADIGVLFMRWLIADGLTKRPVLCERVKRCQTLQEAEVLADELAIDRFAAEYKIILDISTAPELLNREFGVEKWKKSR